MESKNEPKRYRCNILRVADHLVAIVLLGLAMGAFVVQPWDNSPGLKTYVMYALVWSVGTGLLGSAVLSLFFRTRVDDEGVRAYDFWGRPRTVSWGDVTECKGFQFACLPFVRIFTANGKRPLWVPLFHARQQAFEEHLLRVLDAANPLRVFLEARRGQRPPGEGEE